jgi:transaldolase
MAFFVDTAILEDAYKAKELGWIKGITTNPTLLAQSGEEPEIVLNRLSQLDMGPVFYQLMAENMDALAEEAQKARSILGGSLVCKIPPTQNGLRFVSRYCYKYPLCVTAVFDAYQACVAKEAGAHYVAVYVNRATRIIGNGIGLIRDIVQVLHGSDTKIIAASIKSSQEAGQAILAGAHHITASVEVLSSLMEHDISREAVEEFCNNGAGIHL